MTTTVKARDLGDFVAYIDASGGLGSSAFKQAATAFQLVYETEIDVQLDPYSERYVSQQMNLYREMTGLEEYETGNEYTHFDIGTHASAANAYGVRSPQFLVLHYLRLGELIQCATLPIKPRVLDLGAGWGLSSEFFATLGADVTAVDVNPLFVELISRRSARLGLPILAIQATFDELPDTGQYDLITFYECLHHAVRPWELLRDCANRLQAGGKIGLAGEPIQGHWWPAWGLRLDAESAYCIRKFGWFESGWSSAFLTDMFAKAGMQLDLRISPTPGVGFVGIASTSVICEGEASAGSGWLIDGPFAISLGNATLSLKGSSPVILQVHNFRGAPIWCNLRDDAGRMLSRYVFEAGESSLRLDPMKVGSIVTLESEMWVPDEELKNGDSRKLSFHVKGLKRW